MKLPRRTVVHLAAAAAAFQVVSRVTWAENYPSRPVRIIVGFAPGGGTDLLARLMGQWLSDRLAQQFVVENRPGAAGNIATESVARAAPDGYTLLMIDSQPAINVTLFDKLNFDFIRDVAPVVGVLRVSTVMAVSPSVPAKTVSEFIAYAKASPGKLGMASPGNGSAPHLTGELFKMMAGVDMFHVPYRGGALAMTDLIAGQVQVLFIGPSASIEYIRTGRLRALAVTSANRLDLLPDIPTVSEFVPGFEASGFFGIVGPKNTPSEIVKRLNREINAGLADPKIKARLADYGGTVLGGSPADFDRLIADETEKWARVIRFSGIKAGQEK